MPLLSKVSNSDESNTFDILYISPLKALINDQHKRLKDLCDDLRLPVVKWHGDVSASVKQKAQRNPGGVLLITPESLESLLMRKGLYIPRLFGGVTAIVIDELHAFMGTERGVQLRSLMNRLEVLVDRKIDRIGLSAPLGDMDLAGEYLRANSRNEIPIISSSSDGSELKLQLRSYIEPESEEEDPAQIQIANHIFSKVRGKHNLIFAGSKKKVELYGATLRDMCLEENRPNEFFTHHANISKPDREALEARLKEGRLPTTAVCTSTLELGIDIGDVEAVVQIGCGGSVSALRQRMGRSGRRGEAAILRVYDHSYPLNSKAHMIDHLRPGIVQSIAEIQLLLSGSYEPPDPERLHLSTFIHQIIALIKERGGANPHTIYSTLCSTSPFQNISQNLFKDILRAISRKEVSLIEQAPDGTIMLGRLAEKLASHYSFYAVFETQEEFRVICNGKELGSLPVMGPTAMGNIIIFSGRRWKITSVRVDEKVIEVQPSKGGTPPKFEGNGPSRHKIIDEKMKEVYSSSVSFSYLDSQAENLLNSARKNFDDYNLAEQSILKKGAGVIIFPWAGSSMITAFSLIFQHKGFEVANEDYALEVKNIEYFEAIRVFEEFTSGTAPNFEEIAWSVGNKCNGEYDKYLTDEILVKQVASIMPTIEELVSVSTRILCPLGSY